MLRSLVGSEMCIRDRSRANHLRSNIADKAPQRASLPSSSSTKLALRSGAKGSSLSVDSGAYGASAPKDIPNVLSREVRAKALFSANYLCGDKKNRASSYAQSKRASALNRLGRPGLTCEILDKQTEVRVFPNFSLLLLTSGMSVGDRPVHCRLGPISANPPDRRSIFDRLSERDPVKHRKRSISEKFALCIR